MNEFQIVVVHKPSGVDPLSAMDTSKKFRTGNPEKPEVRRTGEGPIEVGTTRVLMLENSLGRSFESCSEYFEYVPNERSATRTVSGPFHLEIENTFEAVDGGTRLTSIFRGESQGFFKLAEPLVVRLTKWQFETAMENLKELLEADVL